MGVCQKAVFTSSPKYIFQQLPNPNFCLKFVPFLYSKLLNSSQSKARVNMSVKPWRKLKNVSRSIKTSTNWRWRSKLWTKNIRKHSNVRVDILWYMYRSCGYMNFIPQLITKKAQRFPATKKREHMTALTLYSIYYFTLVWQKAKAKGDPNAANLKSRARAVKGVSCIHPKCIGMHAK